MTTDDDTIRNLRTFLIEEVARIGTNLSSAEPLDFLKNVEELERVRSDFISKYRQIPLGCESFFVVLRKWNSYTPSLPAALGEKEALLQHSIGGGYFLYIQGPENQINPGYGLVIDPGYNFIHNFGLAGFCLDDIDGILITHAHNDHTNDFESLLSLLYQRNHKYRGRRLNKKVDLFLNVGSFKKFSNYLELANSDARNYIGRVTVMSPGQTIRIPNREELEFEIVTLYTEHHEIVTADYSLGICFKVYGRNLLLTGDTGWSFQKSKMNEDILRANGIFVRGEASDNVDVLVVHIGTIKRAEFNIADNDDLPSHYYDKHLGILGVISVIEQWKPDLCVISEFGEELNEIRELLSREIDITCKKIYPNICCLPGDIGLFIFLDSKKSLCYLTRELVEWDKIGYKDIEENQSQRSIKYFSPEMLSQLGDQERILQGLEIKSGLKRYRKSYLTHSVIPGFQLDHHEKADLVNDISNIVIDSSDPSEADVNSKQIVGCIIALSCVIDDPLDLIESLLSGNLCSIEEIALVLNAYNIETSHLDELVKICVAERFTDVDRSAEESALYEAKKTLIRDFLVAWKSNAKEAVSEVLNRIKGTSIENIWAALDETVKVDILIDNRGQMEKVTLEETKAKLCSHIRNIFDKIDYLEAQVQSTIESEEMYWEGYSFSRTTQEFEKVLEETEDEDRREKIVVLIELSRDIDVLLAKYGSIKEELLDVLNNRGYSITSDINDQKSLFYIINNALIEDGRSSLPKELMMHLEEILK